MVENSECEITKNLFEKLILRPFNPSISGIFIYYNGTRWNLNLLLVSNFYVHSPSCKEGERPQTVAQTLMQ